MAVEAPALLQIDRCGEPGGNACQAAARGVVTRSTPALALEVRLASFGIADENVTDREYR